MPIFFLVGGYSNGVSWRAQLRKHILNPSSFVPILHHAY